MDENIDLVISALREAPGRKLTWPELQKKTKIPKGTLHNTLILTFKEGIVDGVIEVHENCLTKVYRLVSQNPLGIVAHSKHLKIEEGNVLELWDAPLTKWRDDSGNKLVEPIVKPAKKVGVYREVRGRGNAFDVHRLHLRPVKS